MADDTRISDLAALLGADMAPADEFVVVDKSDFTMGSTGTDKRVVVSELAAGLSTQLGLGTAATTAASAYDLAGAATTAQAAAIASANTTNIAKATITQAGGVILGTGAGAVTELAPGTVGGKAVVADPNATNKVSVQYAHSIEAATRGTTGSFASTFDRALLGDVARTLTGGVMLLSRICVPKGALCTSAKFWCITTSASAPTHQWFALYDVSFNLLAVTSDDTSTAWTANAAKTLNFATPYTTTYAGVFYVGVMCTATTTLPGIASFSASLDNGAMRNVAPLPCFVGGSGLTTPATAPNPITSGGTVGNIAYAELL